MHILVFMRKLIFVGMTDIYQIHIVCTHILPLHCLSFRHTHSAHSFSHTRTHTHKCCTTLSVLEFYILMKEEAHCPMRGVRAGRDHFSVDSRVVWRQFGGASSRPSLLAQFHSIPLSAGYLWYNLPGSIRTPPLSLPLFCQC